MITPAIAVLHLAAAESLLQQAADVGQAIAGVTSLVLVVSVPLLVCQVRQQARASRVALITGMTTLITNVGNVFVDRPHMRRYFYEDCRPPAWHHAQASAIAVGLVGVIDHVVAHFDELDDSTQKAWQSYFRDVYSNSPVLREHLETRWGWYGPKLRAHLDRAYTREALEREADASPWRQA